MTTPELLMPPVKVAAPANIPNAFDSAAVASNAPLLVMPPRKVGLSWAAMPVARPADAVTWTVPLLTMPPEKVALLSASRPTALLAP